MPTYPGSPRLTVDALLKQPRILSRSLTSLTSKRFIADKVLAKGTPEMVAGGSAVYQKSETIYPDQGQTTPEQVGVRAEFPRAGWTEELFTAAVRKFGLEIPITFENVRRNQMDQMARGQKKLANALTKFVDGLMMTMLLTDVDVLTDTASADWSTQGTDIIGDLADWRKQIYDLDEGYEPDTLLLNPAQELDLLMDTDIRNALPRESASSAVQTGVAPLILGINQMLVSPTVTAGTVFLLESKTIGTVADEHPDSREGYSSTPVEGGFSPIWVKIYEETKRDEFVIRVARFPAMWLAEPKAALRATGA